MNRIKSRILHPFLFGIYPILMLSAFNIEGMQASTALRSLLLSLAGTTVLLLSGRLLARDWHKAALITSLIIVLFYSYGHVYNFLESISPSGIQIGRHRFLAPLWTGLFLVGFWWITSKARDLRPMTQSLNVIAGIILLFPLGQIGLFGIRSLESASASAAAKSNFLQLQLPDGKTAPDIYYIILDGYARDDILRKFYQVDNTDFLGELEQMGFYVARCAQSNYAQTELSLASSLNSNYLEQLDERYSPGNASRVGLPDLIRHSATRRELEHLGYQIYSFETGYEPTEIKDADQFLSSKAVRGSNDFENLLIRTTAGRILAEGVAALNIKPDWEARDQAHRKRVLYTLEKLPDLPAESGPKFVFAHIVSPHWPHVFGPNGEPVHEHQDSASGYRNQVIFMSKQISPVLASIISNSPTPPIILLQADHGSVIESPVRRMSILNAYYLPDGGEQMLYESISPVNSFRVIFDYYFGGAAKRLEDTSYYSTYDKPFDYLQISNTRPGCSQN
ncbi:MAG TPA: hypothetical protein VE136_01825 [Anaerolineales bacterium]|nr:hypothetical protein [Anaerolineales bacterium]